MGCHFLLLLVPDLYINGIIWYVLFFFGGERWLFSLGVLFVVLGSGDWFFFTDVYLSIV